MQADTDHARREPHVRGVAIDDADDHAGQYSSCTGSVGATRGCAACARAVLAISAHSPQDRTVGGIRRLRIRHSGGSCRICTKPREILRHDALGRSSLSRHGTMTCGGSHGREHASAVVGAGVAGGRAQHGPPAMRCGPALARSRTRPMCSWASPAATATAPHTRRALPGPTEPASSGTRRPAPTTDDPGFREGCRAFVEDVRHGRAIRLRMGAARTRSSMTASAAGRGPGFEAGCEAYVAGFGP